MPMPLPENILKLEQPSVALVPPSEPAPAIAPAAIMPVDGAVPNPVASEIIGTRHLCFTSDKTFW